MYIAVLLPLLALPLLCAADPLTITKTLRHACKRPTQRGDAVDMHYRGTLEADGSEFDASYKRGQPLSFKVGAGMVIKGWDEGLLDMCVGDKRTLRIEPEIGYGSRAMGPIPANSVLGECNLEWRRPSVHWWLHGSMQNSRQPLYHTCSLANRAGTVFETELVSIGGVEKEDAKVIEEGKADATEAKPDAKEPEPVANPQDGESQDKPKKQEL